MTRTHHPHGARVRHVNEGPVELLVVDIDRERGYSLAAWKTGDAVSERWFPNLQLEPIRSHPQCSAT